MADTKSKREMQQAEKRDSSIEALAKRLAVDGAAALLAAFAVSPVMTIIDRAVTEAAAGHSTTLTSVRSSISEMICRPHRFIFSRPFAVMLLLYSGTYLTANSIDTMNSHFEGLPASSTTSSGTKFCAVTGVNVFLALYKDSSYARTFGTAATRSRPFPRIAFAPFIVRDGITLFATFNVPAIMAPSLPESWERYMTRLSIAQLVAPAASQFIGTPLHLLGLDLYYRNGNVSWRERMLFIRRTWLSSSFARACRIVPAYGLGGIVNNDARAYLMESLAV